MPTHVPLQNFLKDADTVILQKWPLKTPPLPLRNPSPSIRERGGGGQVKNGMAHSWSSAHPPLPSSLWGQIQQKVCDHLSFRAV